MVSSLERIIGIDKEHHIQCYGDRYFKLAPLKGSGIQFEDIDGKIYYDFLAGIAVNLLGYNHPKFNEALKKAIDNGVLHQSNLFYNHIQASYEEQLSKMLPIKDPKLFFCNSGAEAVNGALKCASKNKGSKLISMRNSFHGRYGDALAATGGENSKYRLPFLKNLRQYVEFIDFNDLSGLDKINDDTYAVIFEPIQMEGGVIIGKEDFIKGLREKCDETGAILIADEVQTGFGRTGKMFACELYGIEPDIICMAKGIANGFPMGAFAVNKKSDLLKKGEHASTFGGNYLACSAASAVLQIITKENLCENSAKVGEYFLKGLFIDEIYKKIGDYIRDVRGRGLAIGVEVDSTEKRDAIIKKCYEDEPRVIFGPAGTSVIRITPPLIVNKEECDIAVNKLSESIRNLSFT